MPERDPAINPVCLRCGADAMIPDVTVQVVGYGPVKLTYERRPSAKLLKRTVTADTTASVCGECGTVEFRAADPHVLWDAHAERLMDGD